LLEVERALRRIASTPGADVAFWTPAALLALLAQEGKTFTEFKGSSS
jgi:hypothetical protein